MENIIAGVLVLIFVGFLVWKIRESNKEKGKKTGGGGSRRSAGRKDAE